MNKSLGDIVMSNNVKKMFVYKNYSIKKTLSVIDSGARGIVLLVNDDQTLIGTITDGDIRRALLKGAYLDDTIENIAHYSPISVTQDMTREEVKDIFIKNAIQVAPIVDDKKKVIDLITISDILLPQGKENIVIIMAGGLGTRLKELTKEVPKPMLRVGQYPMLHHIINNFKTYGYNKILMSVNYKAEIIENYFQDGCNHGAKIGYIKEEKRLGTAGGIKLAEEKLNTDFFVINGDIFTNLNVENMMKFHKENNFDITVGIRRHSFQIPYGVIQRENNNIVELKEKPEIEYFINAGVYCLSTNVLKFIPNDEYFEITDLINICIKNNMDVGSYEIKEYWMDIGQLEDYNKVNEDIDNLEIYDRIGE